jgi:hypothetical protein
MTSVCGRNRVHIASMASTPAVLAASATAAASAAFRANGFSTSTGLPAAMASNACFACSLWGEAMYTASTSGSETSCS